jgi:pimeloyl-ACP methyl ester carboxylesterase
MLRRPFVVGLLSVLACGLGTIVGCGDAAAGSRAHVYLFRGLFGMSPGMDALAEKLNRRGIHATVHAYGETSTLAAAAAQLYKSEREAPIILIGHSSGGREILPMAAQLGRAGVPVALVIPIDSPSTTPPSANVRRVINLYLSDGVGVPVARGKNFNGQLQNVDLKSDPSMGHFSIQSADKIHKQLIGYVLSAIGGASTPPAAKPEAAPQKEAAAR